ncbi:MAG: hypothetical protein ACLGHY_13075 [Gammaproteobacteria bacterium]
MQPPSTSTAERGPQRLTSPGLLRWTRAEWLHLAAFYGFIAFALLVGTVELLQVLRSALDLRGPVFDLIGELDLAAIGYLIVGLFLIAWAVSFALWKFGDIEQRHASAARSHSHEHVHDSGVTHRHEHLH